VIGVCQCEHEDHFLHTALAGVHHAYGEVQSPVERVTASYQVCAVCLKEHGWARFRELMAPTS
jgi:hypothetical protein